MVKNEGKVEMLTTCELRTERRRPATPSPGPRRLVKAPVAGHPLPQGGEGRGKSVDEADKAEHKCRNSDVD
jgi:hypothetical protein